MNWSKKKLAIIATCIVISIVVIVTALLLTRDNNTVGSDNAPRSGSGSLSEVGSLNFPSSTPSALPSLTPSKFPSLTPSKRLSQRPTKTFSADPTVSPSVLPTTLPSVTPSNTPTTSPLPSQSPSNTVPNITTFYAIGDVPYNPEQAAALVGQIASVPATADFLIHVGDIRNASDSQPCLLSEYQAVATTLSASATPVFIVVGDNEWDDCPNIDEGFEFWLETFQGFESRHWNHSFKISRLDGHPETFAFEYRGTLYVGLNLPGGAEQRITNWEELLKLQYNWTRDLIKSHMVPTVLFAQANPTIEHWDYFVPLRNFIRDELKNKLPILYLNGDGHRYVEI